MNHCSENSYTALFCRNALEDPWVEPKEDMFTRSVSPEEAPDKPTYIEIDFEKGDPVAIDGARLSPAKTLAQLNKVQPLIDLTAKLLRPAGLCDCKGSLPSQHTDAALNPD